MHKDCKYLKDRCAERAAVRRVCPVTCGVKCGELKESEHNFMLYCDTELHAIHQKGKNPIKCLCISNVLL